MNTEAQALAMLRHLGCGCALPKEYRSPEDAAHALAADPSAFSRRKDGMPACVEWTWPRDLRRNVVVPPRFAILVRSPQPFRAVLADPCGQPIASVTSFAANDGTFAAFIFPPEPGDGTGLAMRLRTEVFDGGAARRAESPITLLPQFDRASFKTRIDDEAIRAGGASAVLASPRGASSLVRAAYCDIRGQYDAFLAINPNPRTPSDRIVFFTRCRAWLRRKGYSAAIDASCATSFEATPDGLGAEWRFDVPVGAGMTAPITATLSLSTNANAARLVFARGHGKGGLPDEEPVTLVLRPDVEWRSFHGKTVAHFGADCAFPKAARDLADGFAFAPDPSMPASLRLANGHFHRGDEWCRAVPHPEDAGRGLGPSGDLFSPGWFDIELAAGQSAILTAGLEGELADAEFPDPPDAIAQRGTATVREWADSNPLSIYIADRDGLKTVIAGFPWFLDWGRDTFIVLRGLVADGQTDIALDALREFGRFEENGTLPNIIHGESVGNRDTSDAPLWYAVVAGDLVQRLSLAAVASLKCGTRTVPEVIRSIVDNYIAGTPNGIRVDGSSGLVFSPSHFTWMDTNYPAGTPREGYPVEIQALWIAALSVLRRHFGVADYIDVENKARASLAGLFAMPGGWLSDCLRASRGTRAEDALREDALRPNQLLAPTLGAVRATGPTARAILRATAELIVPGAIRSLTDRPVEVPQPIIGAHGQLNDPLNPFWGSYEGDEDTRRKPAYHNGTAWGWQFPLFCEALWKCYGAAARDAALDLLGSVAPLLETGALRQLPEIVDGASPHTQRGCAAQAWSVSEVIRVLRAVDATE